MVSEKLINWEPMLTAYKCLTLKWRLLAVISVVSIALEMYFFLCHAIPWAKIGVAEWAYWIGAIGTVCTLIGTIWLATTERRNRRRQEYMLAQVTAASFVEQIKTTTHRLRYASKVLGDFSENLYDADYVDLHQKIEAIKVWTPAETIPLIPLSGELAKTLSATCARLGSTQHNLLVAEHDRRMLSDGELQAFIKRQISEYDHMCNTLDGALEICLNAAL